MDREILLNIETPVHSIALLDRETIEQAARSKARQAELERTRQDLTHVCQALSQATAELDAYRTTLFSSHREHIVRLSLEIASRVLAKEVAEKNYAIEKIVLEALQSAPPAKQLTIRLNPDDLKAFEEASAQQGLSLPSQVELAADWSVNPAECAIDSELGIVESTIDEHLQNIGQALLDMGHAT